MWEKLVCNMIISFYQYLEFSDQLLLLRTGSLVFQCDWIKQDIQGRYILNYIYKNYFQLIIHSTNYIEESEIERIITSVCKSKQFYMPLFSYWLYEIILIHLKIF